MTAKHDSTRLQLPPGLTPEEEARWWDDHPEYWDMVETELELFGPQTVRRTASVDLRLPEDLIAALKSEAARRSLPYQTLIQMWLKERLDAEARAGDR